MRKLSLNFLMVLLLHFCYLSGYGQMITFAIPGANNTYITCVNDSNDIAGYFDDATGTHGFIYNGATIDVINYPVAVQTFIYGINNSKKVVGAYNLTGSLTNNEGFKYDPVTFVFTDLTTNYIPSMDFTIARDINDANCVVGDYKQSTTHVCFSMCAGTNASFHYNYKPTYINSVSNNGQRAGFWIDGSFRHGLIFFNNAWTQHDYPGSTRTMFTGVNDSNIAVGIFNLNRSFIYRNGLFQEIKKKGATDFQIHDINTKGKIVGYYKDASNTYKGFWMNVWDIYFRPKPDGWQFANSEENIWPDSWYRQFDYTHDPYLGGNAWFPKVLYQNGTKDTLPRLYFPDWPLFVEAYGEDQCYNTVMGVKMLKAKSALKYLSTIGKWGGSCFGFVQSSFMAWDSVERFQANFPNVGPWDANDVLYNLPLNDENRKCINNLMTKQRLKGYNRFRAAQMDLSPIVTLANVKLMLLDKSKNERGLTIRNQNPGGGGHIVNPYKVLVDTLNPFIEYIYVYDNNCPDDTTRKITIFTLQDCWFYNLAANAGDPAEEWGGLHAHKGLFLAWPVRNWYNPIPIDSIGKSMNLDALPGMGELEVFNSISNDVLISNTIGQTIGYQADEVVGQMPGAMPMMPESGQKQAPAGYFLPEDAYTMELSNFTSASANVTVFNNTNALGYSRVGASLAQKDLLTITEDALFFQNSDNLTKKINFQGSFDDAGNEMNVEVNKMDVSSNGNVGLQLFNGTELKLINNGLATSYDLFLRYTGSSGDARFSHDSIPIPANTAHIISPDWTSLQTAILTVFVDNANNGSYEDTLYFGNSELPQILTYPTRLQKTASAAVDTIFLINNGGGILNWSVTSSDTSWLKPGGTANGINAGNVEILLQPNLAAARSGQIIFSATGAANSPYTVKVDQQGLLDAPTALTASDGTFSDGIHIAWNASPGATHYQLFRSTNAGDYGLAICDWSSVTSFVDSSCLKGKFYYYAVKAALDSAGLNATNFSNKDAGWLPCFSAAFSYSGDCSGQATLFKEKSTARYNPYFLWDVNNDGSIDYQGSEVHHVFDLPGVYAVKLIVTDSSLCVDSVMQTLVIKAFPVLTMFSDSVACAGQSLELNAGIGFDAYEWSTGATTPSITIDTTGNGLGLQAVYVKVTNGNGCAVIATSRITWDTCANFASYNLAGNVTYDNSVSTVLNNATIKLKQEGNTIFQTTADAQGHYVLTNLPSGAYQLTGNSDKAWGGVNSTDALRVTRYFVGLISLQSPRSIAADVNGSGAVNSADALLVAKRFVGITNSFVVGDWAFAKDSVVLGATTNQTANLKAVVYGDVDGSYFPPAKLENSIDLSTKGLVLANSLNEVEIPVSVSSELEVGAVSLVLNIPEEYVQITDVTADAGGTLLYNIIGRELRISWYSLSPMKLSAGDELLSIKGKLKPGFELSHQWKLEPASQLANAEAEPIAAVKITVPEVVMNSEQYYLGQNIPNPFSTKSEISWFMPEAGRVVLKVYDVLGNEVLTLVDAVYNPGTYITSMDANDLHPGTYNYRIEISGAGKAFRQTKQFVIIK